MNIYFDELIATIKKKNYYLIYTSIEYLTFTSILYTYIQNKKFKLSILFLSFLFITFLIVFYSISNISRIDSIPIGIESILLYIFIFYYFYESLKNFDEAISLGNKASFWFIAGIFVYLAITFFFNILANSLAEHEIEEYYHFSFLGDIIKNILFGVGIYVLSKNGEKKVTRQSTHIPYLDNF